MHKILPFFMDDRLVLLGLGGAVVCISGMVMYNMKDYIDLQFLNLSQNYNPPYSQNYKPTYRQNYISKPPYKPPYKPMYRQNYTRKQNKF